MDKFANKENACEQLKKSYKELDDKADGCEQRWKALAHKKRECEDAVEKMQNYVSILIQNS